MSNKISRYLRDSSGNAFSSDTDLQGLSKNSVVKNINSGLSFKKTNSTGTAVFDKVPIDIETDAVLYTAQTLTKAQKTQARNNIGALATSDLPVGSKKQKGILQVGSGIKVSSGVISVDDKYIRELVGSTTPEIKEAIYSTVSVFGTSTSKQKSVVGQSYAGSKLYTTTSTKGEDTSAEYALELSEPLSGTWKCITASSVKCTKETALTSATRYSFEVKRGVFIKA